MPPGPPISSLLPYTTLFRSGRHGPPRAGDPLLDVRPPDPARRARRCAERQRDARRARVLGAGSERAGFLRGTRRSEEHTSELQSLAYLVCRLLLEIKKRISR